MVPWDIRSCHWFLAAEETLAALGLREVPFFTGDFYLFRRTPKAEAVFARARALVPRIDELKLSRDFGSVNDEVMLSLAMAQEGLSAIENAPPWIMQMQHWYMTGCTLDYSRPLAECMVHGKLVRPVLMHFQTHRTQPLYHRERYKVQHFPGTWMTPGCAVAAGLAGSVAERAARRLKRLLRRMNWVRNR